MWFYSSLALKYLKRAVHQADGWLPLYFITKGMGHSNSSATAVPYPISLANRTSFHENCLDADQCSEDDEKTEYPIGGP